jgi:hypothetical protein
MSSTQSKRIKRFSKNQIIAGSAIALAAFIGGSFFGAGRYYRPVSDLFGGGGGTASSKGVTSNSRTTPNRAESAAFMKRWNDLTKGPALVTTGSIVLSWKGSTPGPTEPITVKIDSANEWTWNIPKITFPGGSHHAEAGIVTTMGSTLIDSQTHASYHFGTNDTSVVSGIPLLRYQPLQQGYPFLSISSPTVVSANSTGWKVKFGVLAPYCYTYHPSGGGQCSSGFDTMFPVLQGSQTLPKTVTLDVKPSASGGLSITLPPKSSGDNLPNGTINVVEPAHADGTS